VVVENAAISPLLFDVQSSLLSSALTLGSGGSFGNYSGLLTNPRIMQFALRYEF
jgi:hypothetical protein